MKYFISKTKIINADLQSIYTRIADLTNWHLWSPWAVLDQNAVKEVKPRYLSWESKFTGSGSMTITSLNADRIKIDLEFLKPFKSSAKVEFILNKANVPLDQNFRKSNDYSELCEKVTTSYLEDNVNSTNVTWSMQSKLPFFLIFFKKMFEVMIGRDFERGLTRLKYLAETGSVPMELEFIDIPENIAPFKVLGYVAECKMVDIHSSMHESFTKIQQSLNTYSIKPQRLLCFCDKFKMLTQKLYYMMAAVYVDKLDPHDFKTRLVPQHRAIKVVLHGNYDFMGDAWTGIYCRLRGLKLKADKKVAPYEVYIKGALETDNSNEYITEIYMPVK